jgi:hypothetical protein
MEPMKLGAYITRLNAIKKKYGPDLILVSSSDDEGNSFGEVYYSPTVGILKGHDDFEDTEKNPTHLCVN